MTVREACMRCGEVDYDRRTLWMACLYAMHELEGIPFAGAVVEGVFRRLRPDHESIGCDDAKYERPLDPTARKYHFYTLRVCKDCRGEWMAAIAAWFNSPKRNDWTEERCIPVRVLGGIQFLTRDEYANAYPGRTPVVFKMPTDVAEENEP